MLFEGGTFEATLPEVTAPSTENFFKKKIMGTIYKRCLAFVKELSF